MVMTWIMFPIQDTSIMVTQAVNHKGKEGSRGSLKSLKLISQFSRLKCGNSSVKGLKKVLNCIGHYKIFFYQPSSLMLWG